MNIRRYVPGDRGTVKVYALLSILVDGIAIGIILGHGSRLLALIALVLSLAFVVMTVVLSLSLGRQPEAGENDSR